MVGTYHQRLGEPSGGVAGGVRVTGRLWGREIADGDRNSIRLRQDGRSYGYQLGAALLRFGSGAGRNEVGVYSSILDGAIGVHGFAGGLLDQYVGRTIPKTTYAGAYWTYLADGGLYVDTVVQHSWYDGHADSTAGNRIAVNGSGMLGSIETGYPVALSERFTIEPQAQFVVQDIDLKRMRIPNADIVQHGIGTLTGRFGARLIGAVVLGERTARPYFRANVWKQFGSSDRTTFSDGASGTVFRTPTSSLYGQTGAGFTVPLGTRIAAYGEGDYSFTLDHHDATSNHGASGSVGVKMQF